MVHGSEPKPEPMDNETFDAMVEVSAELEARQMNGHGRTG